MCGFKFEAAAQEYYSANRHLLRVIRTSAEDDEKFGPIKEAYDVNWRG